MKRFMCILLLAAILVSPSVAQENRYVTGVGIRRSLPLTDRRVVCETIRSQQEMERELKKVGWPLREFTPKVDWNQDALIIIAPNRDHVGHYLALADFAWTGSKFALHFGWLKYDPKGSYTYSAGLPGLPSAEIMVVKVKRYVLSYPLTCYEHSPK